MGFCCCCCLLFVCFYYSANAGDAEELGFYSSVGKIPWRKTWYPTPIFLPGKFHGQRSLADYSPRGRRVRHVLATEHTLELIAEIYIFPQCTLKSELLGQFLLFSWRYSSEALLPSPPIGQAVCSLHLLHSCHPETSLYHHPQVCPVWCWTVPLLGLFLLFLFWWSTFSREAGKDPDFMGPKIIIQD